MARPWRIQYEGAIYHIMSRGIGRGKIFLTNDDYSRLLEYIENAREKFNLDIFAFVLMSNHYHLLIETPKGNLSDYMQHFNMRYTRHYNIRHKKVGHIYQGRFKGILVDKDTYLTMLSRYIHLNPVKIKSMKNMPYKEKLQYLKKYR